MEATMALPQLQHLSKLITMSRNRFLYGLEQTPDDRLGWCPGGGAQTPLGIAGKAAGLAHVLTHLIEHQAFPERPATPPPPPADRAAARAAVEASFTRLQDRIASLSETDLHTPIPSPWGAMIPLAEMLWWTASAIGYMQGQLNYAQTAYGDMNPNIPPEWGTHVP
jgi:hypothetical protein